MTPTQAGKVYFERILPLVEEMNTVHQSLGDLSSKPSGRLRVTASVSYGEIFIAPKLKDFRTQYPDIELELILSDGRLDIVNEQIDIAIRHGSLSDSSLVARKLSNVTYHLVSSPAYIEKFGKPIHPYDLKKHEIVTFPYENFRDVWTFATDQISQKVQINTALSITNAAAIRQCVRDGAGIALLAAWTVEGDIKSKKLVELLPEWRISGASSNTSIWLVYPSKKFIPLKTRAFTEFLITGIGTGDTV